jgi:hypothetical protein
MGKVIQGSVDLGGLWLTELPDFLKDVVVERNFYCDYNSLTSLEGAPKVVGENFYCQRNSLTTLEDLPKEIGGHLYISFAPGISFTVEEIRKVSDIKGFIYIRR